MPVDYLLNGSTGWTAGGSVADRLLMSGMDYNVLRPFIDAHGRSCVGRWDQKQKKVVTMLTNTPATLPRDTWLDFDRTVVKVARPELRVWGDISSEGLTYNVPGGMGVTVIQHQTVTDAGDATLSMDGLRQGNRDRPQTDLANLPLPIVHSDFSFSLREIEVSRRSNLPLDTTMVEAATRRCTELIEKLTLGTLSSYTYGGGTIYGLTNFPNRITKTLTLPTASGWRPQTLITELLDMIQAAQDKFFSGPYGLWISPGWTKYLDDDYADTYGGKTLRQRITDIGDVKWLRKTDYLTGFQAILVHLSPMVVQAVTGMRLRTVQWDEEGGMKKNFKVMGIMVPRVRSNADNNTGIVHGVAA